MNNSSTIYSEEIEVPAAFNLTELATKFLSTREIDLPLSRVMDAFALLLFHIHTKRRKNVDKGKISKNELVAFHVNRRRELVTKTQKEYLEFLIEEEVVKTNGKYRIGSVSTKFMVNIPSRSQWVDYTISDNVLLKKLNALQTKLSEVVEELEVKVTGLSSVLQIPNVTVHPNGMLKLKELWEQKLQFVSTDHDKDEISENYRIQLENLEKINNGDYKARRDIKGGRFHSRIVTINREIRPYILIGKEPASELDIKNSQPFFMQVLTQPQMWLPEKISDSSFHISDFNNDMFLKLNDRSEYTNEIEILLRGRFALTTRKKTSKILIRKRDWKVMEESEGIEIEIEEGKRWGSILLLALYITSNDEPTGLNFLKLAQTGEIYDLLTAKYKGRFFDKHGNDFLINRNEAKQTILEELYRNPKLNFPGRSYVLDELFPNFSLFLKVLKETGFRNPSLLVQRIEAKIFIEGAIETFLQENRGEVAITVHDSVLVKQSIIEKVKEHTETYIEKVVGVKPVCAIKCTNLTDS